MGWAARIRFTFSGSWNMTAVIGVRIIPGTTALTRTPSGPSSNAIVWVIPTTPYFDAEYGRRLGTPLIPAAELRFTIAAGVCASFTARAKAWHMLNVPSRLTDRTFQIG